MSAGEVSDAAVDAGILAGYSVGHHVRCEGGNPCGCYYERWRGHMRSILTAAIPHLSPRPDVEVEQAAEIERLRAINDTLGELLRAAEPRVARAISQSHQSLGRLDALQAAVDVVIGDLNALLDDCSQHGADKENFVRVSAVREVLGTARLTTEQWDEAFADCTPAPVPVETLACTGGHLGHRRGIGCVRPAPTPVDDREALADALKTVPRRHHYRRVVGGAEDFVYVLAKDLDDAIAGYVKGGQA